MTVQEAKAHIFDRLCSYYHKNNQANDLVDGELVRKEKNIPETVFDTALREFMDVESHMYIKVDPERRLTLGSSGLLQCQGKINPYR